MSLDLPPAPLENDLRSRWALRSDVAYLNHGSFGAVPRCVTAEQEKWRCRIEAEPIELLARQLPELLAEVRRTIGTFLGMAECDLALVTNATDGINAVLRSLPIGAGDELLTTNHVYHAVRQAMRYTAEATGASFREIEVAVPVASAEQVRRTIRSALTDRTRLLVIDHVTSPTALTFPIDAIVADCRQRGADVLVDGAHAPGMAPLDVASLGATYYAGNLHKWVCAPRGSAFLWVAAERQGAIHPLVISHHFGEGFAREFGWQGTRDFSAWLAIPRAIEFLHELGFDAVTRYNRALSVWVGQLLCRRWNVRPLGPSDGSMDSAMVTVPLPAPLDQLIPSEADALQRRLYDVHRIEAPLMRWDGRVYVRPCCQIYNTAEDYERLARAIQAERDR